LGDGSILVFIVFIVFIVVGECSRSEQRSR
jgi:hypothetical protein